MKIDGVRHEITFSTGRTFKAYYPDVIGLVEDEGNYTVTSGADDQIYDEEEDTPNQPSREEMVELAEYMVAMWTSFRDKMRGTR